MVDFKRWFLISMGSSTVVALALIGCVDDGQLVGDRSDTGGSAGQSGTTSGGSTNGGSGGASGGSTGGASGGSTGGTSGGAMGGTSGDSSMGGSSGSAGDFATSGSSGSGGSERGGAGGSGGSGASGGSGGGTGVPCVNRTCSATETCVAVRTIGGAVFPPDAGACETGRHLEGNTCQPDFGYTCVSASMCLAGEVNCTCAHCPAPYSSCRIPTASTVVDPSAKLTCEQLAP